ncbi:hypothetical protein DV515_00014336 [Chloebia gouldiae]|uniref:Long-chain-fatty-acid--CoA ligase ACSBG2 n=1 Tax=Chloebia gouldiae TaxID=44316 RepID=A0A3L8RZZ4_CHLGU|nr:hypothetical protein DV515_00014336 [Chloebia gouldiae]
MRQICLLGASLKIKDIPRRARRRCGGEAAGPEMRGTVLCESDAGMALAEPVSMAYCNSALQGSCELAREDVLLNSSPRTAEPHNSEPGEDSKMERCQVDSLCPKASSSPGSSVWTTRCDGEVRLRMEEQGPGSEAPKTVHQLLQESVNKYSDYYALASKRDGQWIKLTYKMYYDEGFAVGIYTTNSPEACHYVAENCSANIIVVENHKQLQKILEIEHRLPHLKGIVQYREEIKEKRPNLYSWREFMELGRDVPDSRLREIVESQKPNQCCTLIYTSGTTGQPKGLTWTAAVAARFIMLRDAHDRQEEVVSYLPLSHIAAQMCDIWAAMTLGVQVYFAQPDALKGSLVETLKEVRPTAFLGVPRVWEKMEEKMKSVGMKASALRRRVATWAKGVGLQTNLKRMNGCSEVPVNFRLAQQLVYRKVRKAIGLDRCTKCYTGAAPITRETLEFFLSLNIPVLELYGMTPPYLTPSSSAELIITAGGENIPPIPIEDAVKNAVPIISNAMLVGDKAKFLSMLLTLKCVVDEETGEPRDDLAPEALEFCQKLGSKATKVSEIISSKDKAIYAAIQKGISAVNERAVSNAQKVQKWVLLEKDFSLFGGELGPTLKLKRPVVAHKYQDQIAQFYTDIETPSGEPSTRTQSLH